MIEHATWLSLLLKINVVFIVWLQQIQTECMKSMWSSTFSLFIAIKKSTAKIHISSLYIYVIFIYVSSVNIKCESKINKKFKC